MRQSLTNLFTNLSTSISQFGPSIEVNQVWEASSQLSVVGTAVGNFKLQCSNDPIQAGFPINWNDIPNTSIPIIGPGIYLIPKTDIIYNYIRCAYIDTSSGTATGTISARLFTHGF